MPHIYEHTQGYTPHKRTKGDVQTQNIANVRRHTYADNHRHTGIDTRQQGRAGSNIKYIHIRDFSITISHNKLTHAHLIHSHHAGSSIHTRQHTCMFTHHLTQRMVTQPRTLKTTQTCTLTRARARTRTHAHATTHTHTHTYTPPTRQSRRDLSCRTPHTSISIYPKCLLSTCPPPQPAKRPPHS